MSLEITKICRTCLALEGALLSIYDNKGSAGNGCVADMLGDLTSVPPKKLDGMPERICLTCVSEINRCYSFKMKCYNSDRTLRQLLNITEEQVDEQQQEEEEEVKFKTETIAEKKLPDDKKKPQKRKADTSQRILNHEVEQEPPGESNEMCSVQAEEELEARYFVIDSEADESDSDERKNTTQDAANSKNYVELVQKFVDQSPENEDDDPDEEMLDSDEYKPAITRETSRKKEELKCPICPMTFVHPRNLTKHIRKHHNTVDPTYDPEEQVPAAVKEDLVEPESNQQTEQVEGFEVEFQAIEEAEENHLMEDPQQLLDSVLEVEMHKHRCPRCGAGFAQPKSLNIHVKQSKCTDKQYSCIKCQKVFISPENLRAHIRAHKEEFACSDCDQVFAQKEDLNEHKALKHNLNMKNQCPSCKKVFTMLSTLKDHMRIHSGEKPFLCSLCGKGFSQNANLRQHTMRHNKTKPFKCELCTRSFVSKGELYSHLRSHTGDQPFACDICKTAFTTSSSLVKHKRIHTGERPYACDLCPLRFTALNTLKNHRRTHTGEKPYKCKFCHRGFAQKSDCAIHMRTHTGERRYVCQICGSAFQQSGTLRTHMKIHRSRDDVKQENEVERNVVELLDDDEMDEDQQQDNVEDEEKPIASVEVGVELGEEELLHYAIEECSSDNNDFSAD